MDRSQAYALIGKTITFGRTHGERTQGVIMKVNPTKCKVRQSESRGSRSIGTIWNVPFSLIYPLNATDLPPAAPKQAIIMNSIWIADNIHAIRMLEGIYSGLSPENLSCDGEASRDQVRVRLNELNRKKAACFSILGRELTEEECYTALEVHDANPIFSATRNPCWLWRTSES